MFFYLNAGFMPVFLVVTAHSGKRDMLKCRSDFLIIISWPFLVTYVNAKNININNDAASSVTLKKNGLSIPQVPETSSGSSEIIPLILEVFINRSRADVFGRFLQNNQGDILSTAANLRKLRIKINPEIPDDKIFNLNNMT